MKSFFTALTSTLALFFLLATVSSVHAQSNQPPATQQPPAALPVDSTQSLNGTLSLKDALDTMIQSTQDRMNQINDPTDEEYIQLNTRLDALQRKRNSL